MKQILRCGQGLVLSYLFVGCLNPSRNDSPDSPTAISEKLAATAAAEMPDLEKNYRLLFGMPLVKKLSDLKPTAQAAYVPYSGNMYASKDGGTNVGGALTRYDQAYGTSAAAWERSSKLHAGGLEEWHGHCNGFASASARHAEPPRSVTVNGVTFSPTDIKALLAEIYMSYRWVGLAGNLCESAAAELNKNPLLRADPTVMDKCEDPNPGSFHLALTNIIGGRNPLPLVVEDSPDRQVWNYPVYRYTCMNCSSGGTSPWQEVSAAQAEQIVTGTSASGYRFNKNAKAFYDIRMQIHLSDALQVEATGRNQVKLQQLRYILEVDDSGLVVGGEWARESRQTHPDFLWFPLDPIASDANSKDVDHYANPQVSFTKVLELWRESWRLAGVATPDEGIQWPYWNQRWARYFDFNVDFNGATNGTVFLGNPVAGGINLNSDRWKGGTARILLNEQQLASLNLNDAASAKFQIEPKPGYNFLAIEMQKGSDKERYDLRLYAVY